MNLLYNLGLCLASPLLFLLAVYRWLRGRLPGLGQRLGFLGKAESFGDEPAVWFHAVSLGEVKAAAALIDELKSRIPGLRVVMTSSTRTGWNAARELLPATEAVFFPPFDFRSVCRRFLRRIRPKVVVILETEIWPNLFRECKRLGANLVVANGRISDRTFPRYLATRSLWRQVLKRPDRIFVQGEREAQRFRAIGAPPEKVCAVGNLKFSSRPARSPLTALLSASLGRIETDGVIVAGSTMAGEEAHLLQAFRQLLPEFPRLWLILAPRHPERFPEVRDLVRSSGLPYQLRSSWTAATEPLLPGVLILDSIGELGAIYELATIAFVGGTLTPTGGHNILEPAYFGRPIVIGPSMTNFQEIAARFLQAGGVGEVPGEGVRTGAIVQISEASLLAPTFRFLLRDAPFRERLGEAARERCQANLSGVSAVADDLERYLSRPHALESHSQSPRREVVGVGEAE